MEFTRIRCPHCKMILDLPEYCAGARILCGNCRQKFKCPESEVDHFLDLIDFSAAGADIADDDFIEEIDRELELEVTIPLAEDPDNPPPSPETVKEPQRTAWQELPDKIRQRLSLWYTSLNREEFVLYVPDGASSQETGVEGLIVTNRRIIFRNSQNRYELQKGQSLKINFSNSDGQYRLRLQSAAWDVESIFMADRDLMKLRRALISQGFEVEWE